MIYLWKLWFKKLGLQNYRSLDAYFVFTTLAFIWYFSSCHFTLYSAINKTFRGFFCWNFNINVTFFSGQHFSTSTLPDIKSINCSSKKETKQRAKKKNPKKCFWSSINILKYYHLSFNSNLIVSKKTPATALIGAKNLAEHHHCDLIFGRHHCIVYYKCFKNPWLKKTVFG